MLSTNAVPLLSLERFSADHDLALLDRWLAEPEVAAWFLDPAHQRAEAAARPEHQQCLLSVDGAPVGYARWQPVDPAALAAVGLRDIPEGALDLDVLLGESAARGQGWGARFVQLLCRRLLEDQSVSLIGMVTSVHHARARRAWEKAGLRLEQTYEDERYGLCHVFTRRRSAIAPATAADEQEATSLLADQLAEHHIAIDRHRLEQAVAAIIADAAKGRILLARQGDAPVGVLCLARTFTLEHGGEAWWIDELFVVPSWRDRAVGTELVHASVALAKSAGACALELEVEETHGRAAHLYARAGFRPLTRRRWSLSLRTARTDPPGAAGVPRSA
jgi:aminoglycoside 6'-N-acetyltransferase